MEYFLAILPFVIMVLWDRVEPRETEAQREQRHRKLESLYRVQ